MKTTWTGEELQINFENGRQVSLDISETKEFEAWVLKRVRA